MSTQVIILNNDSSNESSISDYESNDLNIVENDSTSYHTDLECECVGKCVCNQINVITDEDRKLLDILEKISDPIVKNEILNQFSDLNKEKEPTIESSNSFDLREVFSSFSKPKEVTIQNLKEELNKC